MVPPRNSECPSDLAIDTRIAGELAPDEAAAIDVHAAGCAACAAKIEERKKGFAAIAAADPRKMLAAIRAAAPASASSAWWRRRFVFAVFGLGPVAAAAVVLLAWPRHRDPAGDGLREKGALQLHVFRQLGDGAEELMSGNRVAPGDRLRFAVELPRAGEVNIVGIEADGKLFTAWPLDTADTKLSAGRRELPGAVALDESRGKETLYLVLCKSAPRCVTSTDGRSGPQCGDCATTPFVLDKGP